MYLFKQFRAEISLRRIRQKRYDQFILIVRSSSHFQRCGDGRPRRYAGQNPLFAGQPFGMGKGLVVIDPDDLVDHTPVENFGNKTRPDALYPVRSGLALLTARGIRLVRPR